MDSNKMCLTVRYDITQDKTLPVMPIAHSRMVCMWWNTVSKPSCIYVFTQFIAAWMQYNGIIDNEKNSIWFCSHIPYGTSRTPVWEPLTYQKCSRTYL